MKLYHLNGLVIPAMPGKDQSLSKMSSGLSLKDLAKETQAKVLEMPLDSTKKPLVSNQLTQETLKYYLYYDENTGIFIWLRPKSTKLRKGSLAGRLTRGRIVINICGKDYSAASLAFLYMTAALPVNEVDHINLYSWDNRWLNLRDVTHQVNCSNSPAKLKEDYGVYWDSGRRLWKAQPWINGKAKSLGRFYDKELAILAVKQHMETINV